jgi:hypothetical protein
LKAHSGNFPLNYAFLRDNFLGIGFQNSCLTLLICQGRCYQLYIQRQLYPRFDVFFLFFQFFCVKKIYHLNHFLVYSSVVFNTFIMFYNHHHHSSSNCSSCKDLFLCINMMSSSLPLCIFWFSHQNLFWFSVLKLSFWGRSWK